MHACMWLQTSLQEAIGRRRRRRKHVVTDILAPMCFFAFPPSSPLSLSPSLSPSLPPSSSLSSSLSLSLSPTRSHAYISRDTQGGRNRNTRPLPAARSQSEASAYCARANACESRRAYMLKTAKHAYRVSKHIRMTENTRGYQGHSQSEQLCLLVRIRQELG